MIIHYTHQINRSMCMLKAGLVEKTSICWIKWLKLEWKKMYPCCFITMIPACKTMKHQNDSLMFYKWLVNALIYYAYIHTDFRQNTWFSKNEKIKIPNKNARTALEKKEKWKVAILTKYTSIWGQTTDDIEPF